MKVEELNELLPKFFFGSWNFLVTWWYNIQSCTEEQGISRPPHWIYNSLSGPNNRQQKIIYRHQTLSGPTHPCNKHSHSYTSHYKQLIRRVIWTVITTSNISNYWSDLQCLTSVVVEKGKSCKMKRTFVSYGNHCSKNLGSFLMEFCFDKLIHHSLINYISFWESNVTLLVIRTTALQWHWFFNFFNSLKLILTVFSLTP